MSKIALTPNASGTGTFTIASPNSNTDRTFALPDVDGDIPVFPSGTKMLFAQTTAPTGWTKDTTHNDKALRVVSGTAGSGGSVAFTTAFASQAVSGTVGNTTLTTAQMPSHRHLVPNLAQRVANRTGTVGSYEKNDGSFNTEYTDFQGGNGAHNHSFTGTAINLAVQYVDIIIATKD